jgi:hypothetical protein
VNKILLSLCGSVIGFSQFFERAEMDGSDQQVDAGCFKDNPRRLGKG